MHDKSSAGDSGTVTIFLPSLANGGAERSMVCIANGLSARGATVTLALGNACGPYLDEVSQSVRILDLRASSIPRALPALARHLRKSKPRALLSAMSHANVVAALAHRLAGRRGRLVLSERIHPTSLFKEFPGWRMSATRTLMRLTYPWADALVAVSSGVATDLRQHVKVPNDHIVTIYNPVVDARLQALSRIEPVHPWLQSQEIPVILAVGRLIAQKDFGTLIDAFSRLRRAGRRLRLLILGEGELRASLQAQAAGLNVADAVCLPGFDSNPFSAMSVARVFVLSSRFEGLPGVLIQAMACGARIVSTDCPSGPREILEDGAWGKLVPVGDASAMAAAISASLDDPQPPDVRERAAAFGEERAVSHYAKILGLR